MKIQIWSDVMCPFCYIGKRHFEAAVREFPHQGELEIEWKSFQLDPTIPTQADARPSIRQYLAERKGIPLTQIDQMHLQVEQMATAAGLNYNLEKVIVANSFNTHRIIQLAKEKGLGDEAEECLFYAYFTENKDLGHIEILCLLGEEIGLSRSDIESALTSDIYAYKVKQDIQEAQQLGISGVPFFVLDGKFGISGAQPSESMMKTLTEAYSAWKEKGATTLQVTGDRDSSCDAEGNCSV